MSSCAKLAGEFVEKCGYRPKQGVVEKWYINHEDIDKAATTLANRNTKVTALVLKEDCFIYKAGGNDKTNKVEHALAVGDFSNGYIHTDRYTPLYRGVNENERIQELADGARVVTITKMVDTGTNGELTFKIAGLESGMVISEDTYNSAENSGVSQIACATKEGEEEATGLKVFLMTAGLTATQTWIDDNTYVPAP